MLGFDLLVGGKREKRYGWVIELGTYMQSHSRISHIVHTLGLAGLNSSSVVIPTCLSI